MPYEDEREIYRVIQRLRSLECCSRVPEIAVQLTDLREAVLDRLRITDRTILQNLMPSVKRELMKMFKS